MAFASNKEKYEVFLLQTDFEAVKRSRALQIVSKSSNSLTVTLSNIF
jgi:hypothetical protein